jgi:ribonuclease P protein subunit RPR2
VINTRVKYLNLSPCLLLEMMKRVKKRKSLYRLKIAKERAEILLGLAREELEKNPERSRSYVELARKIGKRYNIRFKKEQKRSFCKKCNQILIPSRTSEFEMDSEKKLIIIKCLNCGNIYRYPYKR